MPTKPQIVVYVSPDAGTNWWPQPPVQINADGSWAGSAQIGDRPQASGVRFQLIALTMSEPLLPTAGGFYTLPDSIDRSKVVWCQVA